MQVVIRRIAADVTVSSDRGHIDRMAGRRRCDLPRQASCRPVAGHQGLAPALEDAALIARPVSNNPACTPASARVKIRMAPGRDHAVLSPHFMRLETVDDVFCPHQALEVTGDPGRARIFHDKQGLVGLERIPSP